GPTGGRPVTNALKALQAYATTGTWLPCGSRAPVFPTALGLMGRRHGVRGIDDYAESTRSFSAGGPPAELLPSWEDRRSPTPRRCPARPGPARRFDWPSGGTEEFLGRSGARRCRRRAPAKGALADPP